MPTKIEEKTKELCQTIIAQPEMISIRKRIDTFMADTGARGQYELLMTKGQALHEKQHSGQPLDGTEVAAFEKQREVLLGKKPAPKPPVPAKTTPPPSALEAQRQAQRKKMFWIIGGVALMLFLIFSAALIFFLIWYFK